LNRSSVRKEIRHLGTWSSRHESAQRWSTSRKTQASAYTSGPSAVTKHRHKTVIVCRLDDSSASAEQVTSADAQVSRRQYLKWLDVEPHSLTAAVTSQTSRSYYPFFKCLEDHLSRKSLYVAHNCASLIRKQSNPALLAASAYDIEYPNDGTPRNGSGLNGAPSILPYSIRDWSFRRAITVDVDHAHACNAIFPDLLSHLIYVRYNRFRKQMWNLGYIGKRSYAIDKSHWRNRQRIGITPFGHCPREEQGAVSVTPCSRGINGPLGPGRLTGRGEPVDLLKHETNVTKQLRVSTDSDAAVRASNFNLNRC
jgi:hypothetical protein